MSNKPIQRSSTAPSIARAYASLGLPTSSSTASWVDRTSTSASHRPSAVSRDSNSRPTKRRKEEEYDSPHHKKTPISRVSSDSSWVDVSPVVETTASTSTSKQSAAQVARSNSAPQPVGSSVGNQAAPASSRASLVASATWPSLGQGSNQVESSSSTTKSASHLRIHKIRTADLKVTIIAHCPIAQSAMDAVQLPYGIQRELARGVTTDLWNWQAVLAKLHLFKDFPKSAAGAYKVASLMLDKPLGSAVDLDVWEELDREQLAILENQGRGLGLQGDWEGVADWYGGRLQQIVKFKEAKDGSLTLELLPLEKRRSFRFARFAGSRRILILRRPKELTPKMQEALCGKFVLCGRVYVPFHTKDTSTYMVEVDEDYQRRPSVHEGDGSRMSLRLFFRAFNDLDLNGDQAISKWTARLDLSTSNSVPVLEFQHDNIFYIPDEYSADWTEEKGKASPEQIMTDGAGFINRAGLAIITRRLSLGLSPAAVQARIAGAKGLWILHPSDDSSESRIWIRTSQNKINLRKPEEYQQVWHHHAHTILDFLCASHVGNMAYISPQSITNLSHNGVSDKILCELMVSALRLEVEPFLNWTGPNAELLLWDTINKAGRVVGSRLQRIAKERARALGLQQKNYGDEYADEVPNAASTIDIQDKHNAELDATASKPLHEQAVEMIQAGFKPQESLVLWSKGKWMLKQVVASGTKDFRIPVQRSAQAFIIPDPLGVLAEGQIYFRSSKPILDADSQTAFHVLTGDALIGRYPLRLASDIRRVTAVDVQALYLWSDVIILPTVGFQSLASYLSGGDYDGDTAFLLWEPALLGAFRQPDLVPPPANLLSENFVKEIETVTDFCERLQTVKTPSKQQAKFQKKLLDSCLDPHVGQYSKFHERAVYMFGYGSHQAIRLGHIFNYVLDGRKSGLLLKREVFQLDHRQYSSPLPTSFDSTPRDPDVVCAKRSPGLPRFILESLANVGEKQYKEYLNRFYKISPAGIEERETRDAQLLKPYDDALRIAKTAASGNFSVILTELEMVKAHVVQAKDKWGMAVRQKDNEKLLLEISLFYADHPSTTLIPNIEEVKASYAYHLCNGRPYFAFSIAFVDICAIKARASPSGDAPSLKRFDQVKSISAAAVRVLTMADDLN